jgi:hypothetical protein
MEIIKILARANFDIDFFKLYSTLRSKTVSEKSGAIIEISGSSREPQRTARVQDTVYIARRSAHTDMAGHWLPDTANVSESREKPFTNVFLLNDYQPKTPRVNKLGRFSHLGRTPAPYWPKTLFPRPILGQGAGLRESAAQAAAQHVRRTLTRLGLRPNPAPLTEGKTSLCR